MTNLAYLSFTTAVLGSFIGVRGHFARAHMRLRPEKVTDSDVLNELMMDSYMFEKYAVGAEWDDAGYWDHGSPRNLLYYALSGFGAPVVIGVMFWSERESFVAATCRLLIESGLNPPQCI